MPEKPGEEKIRYLFDNMLVFVEISLYCMVQTFLRGGAGINAISGYVGIDVWVADMGIIPHLDPASLKNGKRLLIHKIGEGIANLAKGPAMIRENAEKSINILKDSYF